MLRRPPVGFPMSSCSLEPIVQPLRFLYRHWHGPGVGLWDSGSRLEYREDLHLEGILDRALIRRVQRTVEMLSGEVALANSAAGSGQSTAGKPAGAACRWRTTDRSVTRYRRWASKAGRSSSAPVATGPTQATMGQTT